MKTGVDLFLQDTQIKLDQNRIGLLAHPASVNKSFIHTLDLLKQNSNIKITHLYGPEHGLDGSYQDMESVGQDRHNGIPVTSLYGASLESLKPSPADLENIDILICDLQDIGSRYYTFIYTMAFCMEVCASLKKQVLVLDRPNPINGISLEGNLVQVGFESFVGYYPLPNRHSMTIGELALYFNGEYKLGCDLKIIPMQGWKRSLYFDQTDLPWILPSPNMPTLDTALVYPGMCLFEATNLSEGRGTTRPFELMGAPYINPKELVTKMQSFDLKGCVFRPLFFRPMFHKWSGQTCGGLQIHINNRNLFEPVKTGVALLKAVYDLYPKHFKWRHDPYEFVKDIPAIDLLSGSQKLRTHLKNGSSLDQIIAPWKNELEFFKEKRKKYLLYTE